ncbi:hypothetical protein BDZ89DRAFT_1056716 [Hymenopellis radicata]|nr:hypothetical protein BDZ89DRAFT_1056716 [Hymenopellis radicata]
MDASAVLSDDDYDVISNPGLDSSITDLNLLSRPPAEPEALQAAKVRWSTAGLDADDIQKWTRTMLDAMSGKTSARRRQSFFEQRTTRVYVDGVFDVFNVGQAKLSFPFVHLIVGVFDDAQCAAHGAAAVYPHVERCEVVRHCRWVDEVVPDAPWQIDEAFMSRRRIDYAAFDEGATVDPKYDSARVKGYDEVKRLACAVLVGDPTPPTGTNDDDDDEDDAGPFRRESPSPPVPRLASPGSREALPTSVDYDERPPLPVHRLPSPVEDDGSPPADLFM